MIGILKNMLSKKSLAEKEIKQKGSLIRCFLCGSPLEAMPFRYDGKDFCHDCFMKLLSRQVELPKEYPKCTRCGLYNADTEYRGKPYCKACRKTIEDEEYRENFSIGFVSPDFPSELPRVLRWFEGSLGAVYNTSRKAMIDSWNEACPIGNDEETWALFNSSEGVIIRRSRTQPVTILSSHYFDVERELNEHTRHKWYYACMLNQPDASVPGIPSGSWIWGKVSQFDDYIEVISDGNWIHGDAACHYSESGWGGSGPIHETPSCLFPAGIFTDRQEAMAVLADRLKMSRYKKEAIISIMDKNGFLLNPPENTQS